MTDREFVIQQFPEAEAQYNQPVTGADLPQDRQGHWAIYRSHELGGECLGEGDLENDAWAEAARRLREAKN